MIESIIVSTLKNDMTLCALLSTQAGSPSIFAKRAPQGTEFPYVVIYEQRKSIDSVIQQLMLYVDFFDDPNSTGVEANQACERIEFVLDNTILEHDRYNSIRIFIDNASWVEEPDPRTLHYSNVFEIRASRKKWIQETII
jgi:hypothetical protein